jgi:hypothetical protein
VTSSWFFILQLLVPRPINKLKDAPFQMSNTAYLVYVQLHSLPGRHLHRQPEDASHCADMDVLITADVTLPLLLLLLLLSLLLSSSSSSSSFFVQGIYTHIPGTKYVPREYGVAAILLFLFKVLISLISVLDLLYFYISTFRSMCAVPNMAVFCSSLTS